MFYNKNDLEYSLFLGSQELLKGTIHILSFCKYTIFFQKTKRQSLKVLVQISPFQQSEHQRGKDIEIYITIRYVLSLTSPHKMCEETKDKGMIRVGGLV